MGMALILVVIGRVGKVGGNKVNKRPLSPQVWFLERGF